MCNTRLSSLSLTYFYFFFYREEHVFQQLQSKDIYEDPVMRITEEYCESSENFGVFLTNYIIKIINKISIDPLGIFDRIFQVINTRIAIALNQFGNGTYIKIAIKTTTQMYIATSFKKFDTNILTNLI